MSDNIKVVVKVRPLIRREIEEKLYHQWRVNDNALIQIDQNGKDCGRFTFDKVYDESTKTSDVYSDIAKPIVEAATAGFNGTIFAYGQTSSGKTYTMTGTDDSPGIIPLAVINLFDIIKNVPDRDFLVRVSYVEIYNETLRDLLDGSKSIKIHETFQGVKVDATEKVTTSPEEVLQVMKEGTANRQTGATNMNEESSRSHSIFQIIIESREHIEGEEEVGSVNVSQLNLVDLAGSERSGQTGATGRRFREGTHINKSLSVLALVIKQLSDDPNKHANYRDSKLTRILQNSLGGNAKTSIICAVTPAVLEETISTLQFASRAKSIKNTPAVNAVATDATMIQTLTKQLSALKTQLETKKSVEKDNYNLQKQIGNLQRLILNGFSHRSNTNLMSGARRKLQHPRRVTISTLHPIQEDPAPIADNHDYRPISLNTLPEFCPIQNSLSLSTVAEEPRLITPPPQDKKVYFSDEVIEIDSDDDTSINVQTCSPYHSCYESSKTPPCILRKNAKQAEKNFKDIVELTEREKIYTPNVVELMEKLENTTLKIAELEENINKLNELTMSKDLDTVKLKSEINEAKEEINKLTSAKTNLEKACQDYRTKLTDLEVSYETLKKKFKTREEELLSILQEHRKQDKKIGEISSIAVARELTHFIETSRDISLVNSDNETSISCLTEKPVHHGLCSNSELEAQINLKDQTILHLEANVLAQKLKIDTLENINKEFGDVISDLKDKILYIEHENALYKSTIDNLNVTIENQKSIVEKAMTDIESLNDVIKGLQSKLVKTEKISIDMNETDLETMIANEELFISNNENMKNIIQSLKQTLNLRNEEVKNLKLCNNQTIQKYKLLEEELESRIKEISLLDKELESFKKRSIDNITVVDSLILEKNNLLSVECQLKTKLIEINANKDVHEKQTQAYIDQIANLETIKEELNLNLVKKEHEIASNKEVMKNNIDIINKLTKEITTLQNDNKAKDDIIADLEIKEKTTQENLTTAKLTIQKLQTITELLSGNIFEVPQMIDNLVIAFSTMKDISMFLENIANNIINERNNILSLAIQRENRLNMIEALIDNLDRAVDDCFKSCESNMSTCVKNCNNVKMSDNDSEHQALEYKIGNLTDKINTTVQHLTKCRKDKDLELNELKLHYENKLKTENINHLQQIQEFNEKRESLLKNLLVKTITLTSEFDIENVISCRMKDDFENIYEQTIFNLDKIADHISSLNSNYVAGCNNVKEILLEAEKEIHKLTEENLRLVQDISNLENNNVSLADDLKNIQNDSKILTINLKESNRILNELRGDVVSKTSEIEIIESKAKEWKDKFKDLEIFMKEQICMLQAENIELKTKCSDWQFKFEQSLKSTDSEMKFASGDQKYVSINSEDSRPLISPPSLLTICCNRIIETIQPNVSENLESSSTTTSEIKYFCQCKELTADLNVLLEENSSLKSRVIELERLNECFVSEQEEVRKEVLLLIENSHELQKKIVNHRTNLCTLTATTYAENKLLSSQIKFLQHHHNRFHNVCQKDIPALKSQLQELMILLNSVNIDKQNESFKQHSMPNFLDSVVYSKFKNESSFDGDLLMLDTNITLTTFDNTLVGQDQTSLDVTQVCTHSEVACQTSANDMINFYLLHSQIEMQSLDDMKIIESLKAENYKLRDLVDEYKNKIFLMMSSVKPQSILNEISSLDNNKHVDTSQNCKCKDDIRVIEETHKKEINIMANRLTELESQKHSIEEKYRNLTLEVPSSELLVQKLNALEHEYGTKQNEIIQITQILDKKNGQLKNLQNENEILSNQVMESISELDELRKEYDLLKEIYCKLTENHSLLSKEIDGLKNDREAQHKECTECIEKNEIINTLKNNLSSDSRIKLDRSYSDADSSSRYNTICTLQNELHAGKEDCIELKEEVTTIKNHLERSNLSIDQGMDLDDSIRNSHIYSFDKEFENIHSQENKCKMENTTPGTLDEYSLDKAECLLYFAEKIGANGGNLPCDIKLVDIMRLLYDNLVIKHGNEVENFVNKLQHFEESKNELQKQLDDVKTENIRVTKELEEKNCYFQTMANVVSLVRNNIDVMGDAINDSDAIINFKDMFLKVIDKEFGFASTRIFEIAIQQLQQTHDNNITKTDLLQNENKKLQYDIQQLNEKLEFVNGSLSTLKCEQTERETEFNLLKRQKEKVHEITTAVTLDIVRREQELKQKVISLYQFINKNTTQTEEYLSISSNELIDLLFDLVRKKNDDDIIVLESERNKILTEADSLKTLLELKEKELQKLTNDFAKVQDININIKSDLSAKEQEMKIQNSKHEDLNQIYIIKVRENDSNMKTISRLTEEVNLLKETIKNQDTLITSLETKLSACNENCTMSESKISELIESLSNTQKETARLKYINETIIKEKEYYSMELDRANATIEQNKVELDNMATHILTLKESVKQTSTVVDKLTQELKSAVDANKQLQENLDEKCHDCSRLEMNIKTHEKSAEIQSRMIIRLQKQKENDDKMLCDKDLKVDKLIEKCKFLETEYEKLGNDLKASRDEIDLMKNNKSLLEAQISALEKEVEGNKRRPSIDAITDSSRRRRQSIHDSKRMFAEDIDEHKEVDVVFKLHTKCDEASMDVDGDSSSRSTPVMTSRGRDSLSSKHDQDEENQSRPSSVQTSRRRRQSVHDLHRSVRQTPEPHEISRESSRNNSFDSEVTQLRKHLSSCHQELEELKEKYREVDEECEICAQYLRERDEQCLRLRKEKRALEEALAELKNTKSNSHTSDKDRFVDASVNTDEDWTNLHSVVVDRMSYDAEVEKNKRLLKVVEDLRFKKQDLNNTLAKMQKALEKHSAKEKELERELEVVRARCRELDEECETCAAYLRERDERCRRLKDAKAALEAKLLEYTDTAIETRSVRKKRQTVHDQLRSPTAELVDAATETSDDFLSYQVERDNSPFATENQNVELNQLKTALEKLSQQKKDLEQQLSAAPQYVATGSAIVQGQQITDVMKENQKLKKMNAKLITICKKRGKSLVDSNRENEDPSEQIESLN